MTTYGLHGKVAVIVTDNASNMVKAFTLPGMDINSDSDDNDGSLNNIDVTDELDFLPPQRHSCFAHTLQLVVRDGLRDAGQLKQVIAKVSSIVSHVRKSTSATELLQDYPRLETANATRWNSQLKMLRSVLRIPLHLLDQVSPSTSKLTAYDCKLISELCEILQPFEEATDHVQGESVVTSSMVVICIRGLREVLKSLRETYNSKMVATLQASLEKQLSPYEEMDCMRLAATLDPRFKGNWCDDDELEVVKELIRTECAETLALGTRVPSTSTMSSEVNPPPAKRSRLLTFLKDRSSTPPQSCHISEYLQEPATDESCEPLRYWRENQHRFPALSKLACKYLAITASSAPVERLFSVAGKVFRPDRCCLSDSRFEDLMFIRYNLK